MGENFWLREENREVGEAEAQQFKNSMVGDWNCLLKREGGLQPWKTSCQDPIKHLGWDFHYENSKQILIVNYYNKKSSLAYI